MSETRKKLDRDGCGWVLAAALCLAAPYSSAQQPAPAPAPQPAAQSQAPESNHAKTGVRLSPQQQRQLFSLVDQIIQFSSDETGLPIRSQVKRQIVSRAEVESYLKQKMEDDQTAKRMERDEIVLKKFGLLDRDFSLRPFLLALLDEQIEAYYDFKAKTVCLLDWMGPEEQKPVLAHELTHALQDQHSDLEKWTDQTPEDVSVNSVADTDHLARDEMDTARLAVVEGQATAVMMDYILKPLGKSLVKDPEVIDLVKQQMASSADSPVLARAPLLLSESLLFPYSEGLSFEQDVWMDQGRRAAFAGAMDRPPTSTWEILNPREYEEQQVPPVPLLPNIHSLVDKLYTPYDIGQMGQFDVHILTELFGGDQAARDLTPAWDGGFYWAGQLRSAKTAAEQANTKSIALVYLSAWKNAASAQAFAHIYAGELGQKYSGVKLEQTTQPAGTASSLCATPPSEEQDYSTSEGPVVIVLRGRLVFVAESFPLELARRLATLVLDAQGSGAMQTAGAAQHGVATPDSRPWQPLTANLIRFFSDCGVMKAAVEAELRAGQ
jgi:hypothetical protein